MKKLVALLLCLMMVVPATLASAETAEGKVLNIWCWNDEFQSRFNDCLLYTSPSPRDCS